MGELNYRNSNWTQARCSWTGRLYHWEDISQGRPLARCLCCDGGGMPLQLEYDLESLAKDSRQSWRSERRPGVARYEPLLPVTGLPEYYIGDVGLTPILALPQENGSGWLSGIDDIHIEAKLEGGHPSGSFKDRGLAIAIALGASLGAKQFCLPTQGNAGIAAAIYAARWGLDPTLVYMPTGHRGSSYHQAVEHFGGRVEFFGDNIAGAGGEMRRRHAEALGSGQMVDISTFFEPGRLEGKKTLGLEIAEHYGDSAWPNWIIYPTGGGTGLVGIWKAFRELQKIGFIGQGQALPRMVAVQSRACAPVVDAWNSRSERVTPVESKGTMADGLDVPAAIMGHGILQTLRESEGCAVSVSEGAIESAFQRLGKLGIAAGYESAATLAAVQELIRQGLVQPGQRILLLMTSHHGAALQRKSQSEVGGTSA